MPIRSRSCCSHPPNRHRWIPLRVGAEVHYCPPHLTGRRWDFKLRANFNHYILTLASLALAHRHQPT